MLMKLFSLASVALTALESARQSRAEMLLVDSTASYRPLHDHDLRMTVVLLIARREKDTSAAKAKYGAKVGLAAISGGRGSAKGRPNVGIGRANANGRTWTLRCVQDQICFRVARVVVQMRRSRVRSASELEPDPYSSYLQCLQPSAQIVGS